MTDDLLADLDDAQRAAVTSDAMPLCIEAGAGSGKTRVLTRRIAHRVATGSAEARHVLALTFTRKAAGEMGRRLHALGVRDEVAAGTFHAVAYAQLRRRWADRGESPRTVLEHRIRLLRRLVAEAGEAAKGVFAADVATEVEWAKARMVSPDAYEGAAAMAGRTGRLDVVASLYARYEQEKRRRGLVDLDDLLQSCADALEHDGEFAAAQRWHFRHLFVDEFQDVNPLQFRLLSLWLGDRADLCVVGDPAQAIYGWNGADPNLLVRFRHRFPSAEVVRLDQNYRSTPQVLTVAGAVLWRDGRRVLQPNRPDGIVPTVRDYESDAAEAAGIASDIVGHRACGEGWAGMAVLTRTNAQCTVVGEALERAGVPYRMTEAGLLLEQAVVRSAIASLRAAPAGTPLRSLAADVDEMAEEAGGETARLQLEALARHVRTYTSIDAKASVDDFAAWLSAGGDEGTGPADAVTVATFHRAKGLEWPVVYVAGLERGLVPIGHAQSKEALAEERRLLYVACTRAQRELHCSWARRRTFSTRTVGRGPSMFLSNIEEAIAALGGPPPAPRVAVRERVRAERERLRTPKAGAKASSVTIALDAEGEAVLGRLKEWRRTAARAAAVPAYVIFDDKTLTAVAARRPSSPDELSSLPGIGPVKLSRYGELLLAMVAGEVHSASA